MLLLILILPIVVTFSTPTPDYVDNHANWGLVIAGIALGALTHAC
jgi:hypothetical protein